MSAREPEPRCERTIDAAPYVLGALEQDDGYREHLASCAVCRAEVADFQSVVDVLPASAPQVAAPPGFRSRVLATVRPEAELLSAAGSQVDRPPKQRSRFRSPRLSLLGAGLAIAATAIIAVAIAANVHSSTHQRVISAQVAPGMHGVRASLHQSGASAHLVLSGMPQPPQGKIYEVWLASSSAPPRPTTALFGVTSTGAASVNVPGSLHQVSEVLVTAEPRGGSLHPTSSPVLRVVV
jgi:anti-sigma-K factor RskA